MTAATGISVGLGIAGLLGTIIGFVFSLSVKAGRMKEKVENIERQNEEERRMNDEKFKELYTRTNAHESLLAKLTSKVDALNTTCTRIEAKIDKMIEREWGD